MTMPKMLQVLAIVCAASQALAATITGTIYCDNQFEFYFNGELVASDPIGFTPHNAVEVSFEWDEVSDKVYAIMCQDYASDSGYEYTETTSPQLGDGALIAEFTDGTVTSTSWKTYTVTYGPTDASIADGCSATNLDVCVVVNNGTPTEWYSSSFDDSTWSDSTSYTAADAGWGRTPEWRNSECCTMTSPLTRGDLGCNVDSDSNAITVVENECLSPETEFASTTASFIWGSDLERDNTVLFRYTEEYTASPASATDAPATDAPATEAGATPSPVASTTTPNSDDATSATPSLLLLIALSMLACVSLF